MLKKYKATALITVVLIVAMISITAITMQGYLQGEIKYTDIIITNDKLYNKALSLESYGLLIIKKYLQSKTDKDLKKVSNDLIDNINKKTVNNYDIKSTITVIDQTGLFNINYLFDLDNCKFNNSTSKNNKSNQIMAGIFKNLLLINANDTLIEQEAQKIVDNTKLWLCPVDSDVTNDSDLNEKIPASWQYQKPKQLFVDKSELKLVPGMTRDIYYQISPYITVFPSMEEGDIKISIENLSDSLFAAMANLSIIEAREKLIAIKSNPDKQEQKKQIIDFITNNNNFDLSDGLTTSDITKFLNEKFVSEKSKYYIINSIASQDNNIITLFSYIAIDDKNKLNLQMRTRA